mgnify:CR=1 FL=1
MDEPQLSLEEEQSQQMKEAETLLSIESTIKERIVKLEQLKEDMKPHKEMLQSYLENDPVYREHDKMAKDASKQKSATKKQLLNATAGKAIVDKIEAVKTELADVQEGLSYYLREYQRMTGANEIEGADGELRQIVYSAKLVRKTNLTK